MNESIAKYTYFLKNSASFPPFFQYQNTNHNASLTVQQEHSHILLPACMHFFFSASTAFIYLLRTQLLYKFAATYPPYISSSVVYPSEVPPCIHGTLCLNKWPQFCSHALTYLEKTKTFCSTHTSQQPIQTRFIRAVRGAQVRHRRQCSKD